MRTRALNAVVIVLAMCGALAAQAFAPRRSSRHPGEWYLPGGVLATQKVIPLGRHLYAYISANDGSSNSTFLVGPHAVLVVDTGLNAYEGGKLLRAIRQVTPLPVRYIVNTHYHLDHQGGNTTVGPEATVISTAFTRRRTLQLMHWHFPGLPPLKPAAITIRRGQRLTVFLGGEDAIVTAAGPAHTGDDAYVYFPQERVVSTGDIYLTDSCPAMDQGSSANWIRALHAVLRLPATRFVPGHFQLGTRASVGQFLDYLTQLRAQVVRLRRAGASVAQVRREVSLPAFKHFRQFPKFHATFADNAAVIYAQLNGAAEHKDTRPR